MKSMHAMIFIFLSTLPLFAGAETFRCTDASGAVSYTNTQCPEDSSRKPIDGHVSVLDNNEERQYIERGIAKAKAGLEELSSAGGEIAGQAKTATITQLNLTNSFIKSAMQAKDTLLIATISFIAVAVVFFVLSRRNRRRQNPPE